MAPRRGQTLPKDPAAAQVSLRKTAEECFERYGIRRVTMDEIAAAAGVSRPTLYRYFGDRESLISSIVESRADRLVIKFHKLLAKYDRLDDRLVAGLLYLVDAGRKDEFIHELLRVTETNRATHKLMTGEGLSMAFAQAAWSPTLEAAAEAGILPEDFDERMAYRWLVSINFMLIGWQDFDELTLTYKKDVLRRFVAAPFLADPSVASLHG